MSSSSIPQLPKSNLLAGKTVVVTGSSRGIGRACALQCAANGADVVLHHFGDELSNSEVAEMADEIKSLGRKSIAIAGVRAVRSDLLRGRAVDGSQGEMSSS
jgi:NAD(P)-dependent dehydrogenase (short-subunit alcohol dehydrogenase family)